MTDSEFIQLLPKAELHLHLDGAVRVKTAAEVLNRSEQSLYKEMVITDALASQHELLKYFKIPTEVLQTAPVLARCARELIEDKASDNVVYCEIRFAPQLHTALGLSVKEVMEAVIGGLREGVRSTGVQAKIIAVALKGAGVQKALELFEQTKMYAADGLCGYCLAGEEAQNPDICEYEEYFASARSAGFGVSFHSGEIPSAKDTLAEAVQRISPSRIAHGIVAAHNRELRALLHKKNILLEVCPTGNIQAGLYRNHAGYPIDRLMADGVPVCVNTDDPTISGVTLSGEYKALMDCKKVSRHSIMKMNRAAVKHAFCGETTKDVVLSKIDEFERKAMDDGYKE